VVPFACLVVLAGCGWNRAREAEELAREEKERADPIGYANLGKTACMYLVQQGGVPWIIWGDLDANGYEMAMGFKVGSGRMSSPDGRLIGWTYRAGKGRGGTMLINNVRFDLAKGNLFLVGTRGGTRVRQLKRDLSKVKPTSEGLTGLAKTDPEVRDFVKAAEAAQ
jgi:hypothetical protein